MEDPLDCLFGESSAECPVGGVRREEVGCVHQQEQDMMPTFVCVEAPRGLQSCHHAGLVGRGILRRLLNAEDPSPSHFRTPLVELLGQPFVSCSVFFEGCDTPFMMLQQRLGWLMDREERAWSWEQLQPSFQQCIVFLHFMECYVHRYLVSVDCSDQFSPPVDKISTDLVTHLSSLCACLDPLEDVLSMLSTGGRGQQAVRHRIGHLLLHVYWTVLSVLFRLSPQTGPAAFLQQAFSTLHGLLSHAAVRYNQAASLREREACPFFPCACVLELWLMLLHTLDHLATTGTSKSFWMLVSQILGEVTSPSHDSEPMENSQEFAPISPDDGVTYAWWVLSQLAPLYSYRQEGAFSLTGKEMLPGNWVFVQELLLHTFQQGVGESQLRSRLHSLFHLCRLWAPATESLSKAWDYFHKHMNDSYHLPGRGVQTWLTQEGSTPRQWFQYIHSLCFSDIGSASSISVDRDWTSFELFLASLAHTLTRGPVDDPLQPWRQLRGRFYSKIYKRWVKELTPTGLRHLISLFLTLAASADTVEVGGKMLAHVAVVGLSKPKEGTTVTLWKGVFSLLLLFEERGLEMNSLVEKLLPAVSELAKLHPQQSFDDRLLWETLSVVLDGLQELLECPRGVFLGAGRMVGDWLRGVVGWMQGGQLSRLLQFIEGVALSLVSLHQAISKEGAADTRRREALQVSCQLLWEHCGLPLLPKAKDPLPPPPLSAAIASLTAFTCECSLLLTQPSTPTRLLEDFGLCDSATPLLASAYLCHVLVNDLTCHRLLSMEGVQWRVAHSWLRCLVLMHNPPGCVTQMQELSRLVLQLPSIAALLGSEAVVPTDPLPGLQLILKAINAKHSDAGLEEARVWRERLAGLLGDLPKYMEPAFSGNMSGDSLKLSYRVAATAVRTCPRLIYSRTDSRCLLPRLVDWLVLPLPSSKRPPVQGVSACIRKYLHHFLLGLLQLEPRRDDFVRRKVKQIFSKYFHSYAQPKNPLMQSTPNPFMLLLQPCFESQVSEEASDHLLFTLEVVTAQFLVLPQQPSSLLPTLQFLRSAVERVQSRQLLVRCTLLLLGHMLSCLLACDVCSPHSEPQGIRKQVMEILGPLLRACQNTQPPPSLLPIARDFVISNIKQCQAAVFKPLQSLTELHPSLGEALLPCAQRALEDVETSRGVGTDSSLRSAYHALESRVRELRKSH